jgi:hypothetical protein
LIFLSASSAFFTGDGDFFTGEGDFGGGLAAFLPLVDLFGAGGGDGDLVFFLDTESLFLGSASACFLTTYLRCYIILLFFVFCFFCFLCFILWRHSKILLIFV